MDLDNEELEKTKEMYKELEDLKRTAFKNYLKQLFNKEK